MGDVIRATRAILDQLDPLSEEERSRVIGTLLTLHGAQQPGREVAVTTAATAPSSPAADPKAGGARPSERPRAVRRSNLPRDGGLSGDEIVPRLLRAIQSSGPLTASELEHATGVNRLGLLRAFARAKGLRLISGDRAGRGCRYTLTKAGLNWLAAALQTASAAGTVPAAGE